MSELYYYNLPDLPDQENMDRFRKDCYYTLLDFTIYLNNARYLQQERVIRLPFRVLSKEMIRDMLKQIKLDSWIKYGYEKTELEEISVDDGEFIQIYDPSGKIDEDTFEDFMKTSVLRERVQNPDSRDDWIRVLKSYPMFNVLKVDRKVNSDYIYYKANPYDFHQQLKAIFALQSKPRKEHRPLLRLIQAKDLSLWPKIELHSIDDWKLLKDPDFPGVQNQRNFVQKAMSTSDFAILHGPPGSGKTLTICELIIQAVKRNKRVLLCASTHVAVDNVLEKIADREEIIAVRIGNEDNPLIPETIKKYFLENRKRTERERICNELIKLGKSRSDGQNYYLNVLQSDNGESEIERLILDNANVVCGTVMGILKHPDIEAEKTTPKAVFDLLIIDEASKTTFQEFIVPALFCKRWILAGDNMQLSPFVDDLIIKKTLDSIIPLDDQLICKEAFCCWKYDTYSTIISEADLKNRENYMKQFDSLDLEYINLDDNPEPFSPVFLGSKIFIGPPETVKKYENSFPMDAFQLGGEFSEKIRYAHSFWEKYYEKEKLSKRYRGSFGELLAWRLVRLFTLRYSENDSIKAELEDDIEKLLPHYFNEDKLEKLRRNLTSIKKVAFPSIIELLKEGFIDYKDIESWKQSVIRNGFNEVDLESRYEKLEFQHRMHPEISEFPRNYIYDGKALRDNPLMVENRKWNYSKYASRSIWINITDRNFSKLNININEANRLLIELEEFLKFAKNSNRKWDVAILTFYRYQEDLLHSLLLSRFNFKIGSREFTLEDYNVKIKVCTVDRFQGQEADIVFLSFVKTNSVGFLNSINRLNVAITRARYQLVMLGNRTFFYGQNYSSILQELANIKDDLTI